MLLLLLALYCNSSCCCCLMPLVQLHVSAVGHAMRTQLVRALVRVTVLLLYEQHACKHTFAQPFPQRCAQA
jgi:hypothetical protein